MPEFPEKLCIVDDDHDFVTFLTQYLHARGCQVTEFRSAEYLLKQGNVGQYEFFILDLGLPGIDGVDLTTLIRGQSSSGILVVSGRMGPDAFNSALAAGADMFINKPVRFDQVFHAVQSVWRRTRRQVRDGSWTFSADGTALRSPAGHEVALSPVESRLLGRLLESGQDPVDRAALAEAAGLSGMPDQRNLDAAIFRLRRKIEREAGMPSPFRTVHGVGYQLSEPVMGAPLPGSGG